MIFTVLTPKKKIAVPDKNENHDEGEDGLPKGKRFEEDGGMDHGEKPPCDSHECVTPGLFILPWNSDEVHERKSYAIASRIPHPALTLTLTVSLSLSSPIRMAWGRGAVGAGIGVGSASALGTGHGWFRWFFWSKTSPGPWPPGSLGVWDGGLGRWRLNLRSLSCTSNFSRPTAKLLRVPITLLRELLEMAGGGARPCSPHATRARPPLGQKIRRGGKQRRSGVE